MRTLPVYLAAIATVTLAFAGTASAATNWDATHPRRVEVNHREMIYVWRDECIFHRSRS